ncbi:hypothetical protein F2P56_018586, partial [Juglans regia]
PLVFYHNPVHPETKIHSQSSSSSETDPHKLKTSSQINTEKLEIGSKKRQTRKGQGEAVSLGEDSRSKRSKKQQIHQILSDSEEMERISIAKFFQYAKGKNRSISEKQTKKPRFSPYQRESRHLGNVSQTKTLNLFSLDSEANVAGPILPLDEK